MLKVKNEQERLFEEFRELRTKNRPLAKLLIDLYHWIDDKYKKDVVMTMIFRTPQEQDYLYRNSIKYKVKPWTSPHQYWHAVDIRSLIFTDDEIDEIVEYLNNKYNNTNYYRWTAKAHKVGEGAMHFHIQLYVVT